MHSSRGVAHAINRSTYCARDACAGPTHAVVHAHHNLQQRTRLSAWMLLTVLVLVALVFSHMLPCQMDDLALTCSHTLSRTPLHISPISMYAANTHADISRCMWSGTPALSTKRRCATTRRFTSSLQRKYRNSGADTHGSTAISQLHQAPPRLPHRQRNESAKFTTKKQQQKCVCARARVCAHAQEISTRCTRSC